VVEKEHNGPRIRRMQSLEVSKDFLEKVIAFYLEKDYEFVSLEQVFAKLQMGRKGRRRFVAFTFDDGYLDNYSVGYEIMKRFNVPFTIYVATDFPDKKVIIWWYLLEKILLEHDQITVPYNGAPLIFPAKTLGEKEDSFSRIRHLIINEGATSQPSLIRRILEPYHIDVAEESAKFTLGWDQIREMGKDGLVTIGAHGIRHLALRGLAEGEALAEMRNSKARIESEIGSEVEHFSYPFGTCEEAGRREFALARRCNFKTATTVRLGHLFPEHTGYMECLPRITTYNSGGGMGSLNQLMDGFYLARLNKWKKIITN
jgi:peptidoglycan/xylan/chitin deacetylase (PgdA/CDA1 family)